MEQKIQFPQKWAVCKSPDVIRWSSGGTPKVSVKEFYQNGTIPWLVIGDLNDGIVTEAATKITEAALESSSAKMVKQGTLLLAMYGSIGKLGIAGMDCCTNQAIAHIKEAKGLSTKFLFFYFSLLRSHLCSLGKGGTQKNISLTVLNSLEIPIPSLEEQERIVAKIEELFSEIDKAEETLAQTRAQLVIYRQGILKHCIDRYRQGSKSCTIKDVCNDIKVGIVIKPAQYYTEKGKGIKAFRSANVREFYVNNAEWVYLTKEGHLSNHRSEVHTGDVLIVRSGYPGTACVVTEEYNGCNAIDILIATPDTSRILPEYLCLFTNSPYGKALVRKHKRGVAQAHLNVSGYSKLEIWVPTLEQQAQAVNMATAQISSCDAISKTIEQGLNQAHSLRQSILKKAFEGELV